MTDSINPTPTPTVPTRRVAAGMRSVALLAVAPLVTYALVRPLVGSDAAALAAGGAIPLVYTIVQAVMRRRADPLGVASAVSFSVACLVSLLTGGSSLPLKLQEAAVTFLLGVVLLGAVMVRRPPPISRWMRLEPNRGADAALAALIGGFLVLHALLHVALAMTLSTGSYLVVGRIVDWGTVVVALVALRAYLKRARAHPDPSPSEPGRPARAPKDPPTDRPMWLSLDHAGGR